MHFDEMISKFWLFKTILALWGQISRLQVGRINSDRYHSQIIEFYLFLVTNVLTKDKNFIHLTLLIYVHRQVRGHS